MVPITQLAINGVIYPEIQQISRNGQNTARLEAGESLFVSWYVRGQEVITNLIALNNTMVAASFLFSNNNWVNNVLATFSILIGQPVRMTLSGASLGQIILGEWNPNIAEDLMNETMTVQLILQTPLALYAPKIVASFY